MSKKFVYTSYNLNILKALIQFVFEKQQSYNNTLLYIVASGKVANVASLKAANSVLECFHVLLDENLFAQNDVTFMQYLCKHIHSDELYRKCTTYALAHESSCSFENPSGIIL